MRTYDRGLILLLLFLVTACAASAPPSTPTASPTWTPTATPTQTPVPTPTATPLPPLAVTIRGLDGISAVAPQPVAVDLVPPPTDPAPSLVAAVLDPTGAVTARFDLAHQGGGRYVAPTSLHLPLEPQPGSWRIVLGIDTRRPVIGEQSLTFEPAPVAYRPLTETLPSGVSLRVPEAFEEIAAHGNARAGYRLWRYEGGELGLWWAPGPTEPLQQDTALMMLEATHEANAPEITQFEETTWGERTAFAFDEDASAEGWVLQDADDQLYILRLRTPEDEELPEIVREVAETFRFASD